MSLVVFLVNVQQSARRVRCFALVEGAKRMSVESVDMAEQARAVDGCMLLRGIDSMVETMQHVELAKGEHAMPLMVGLPGAMQLAEGVVQFAAQLACIVGFNAVYAALC